MSARVVQVIRVEAHRGQGTSANPHRTVVQFYEFDGTLLWESDWWREAPESPTVPAAVPPRGAPHREGNS